ncbi:hypothetical protein INF35_03090 [Subdoligranulum sp. DSM 109015]|uniref:DUF4179 domain-containing protein n=1 Tax=Gemmiger gallinarum TaxID=2779354 RepID=A0ABR9R0W4_9FIRM|nr:hypothetical protein [Gemmiger gallinarum]MBE5036772.1 hypothetical protein [Gemmiger gallinarum]
MKESDLMRNALSAYGLDRQAICRAARREGAARLPKGEPDMKKRKLPVAVAVVLAAACLGGGVYAAGVLMDAPQAAEAVGESDVAALFEGEGAVAVNETQSDGGYDVTLLGLVTGDHLTDTWSSGWTDGEPDNGTTYAVVAVRKSDGTPMPELSDESDPFRLSNSFAQMRLAIPDLQPAQYWLNPERRDVVRDGVRYLFLGCDNVEMFADRDVVLCVSTGGAFYNTEAFRFDETTGAITADPDYAGVNLVFDLPLDEGKADPEAARAWIDEWKAGGPEQAETAENPNDEEPHAATDDAMERVSAMTPAEIRAAGTLLDTQTAAPADGNLGSGWYFADGAYLSRDSWTEGETELVWQTSSDGTTVTAQVLVKNEDGTMTSEIWQLPAA